MFNNKPQHYPASLEAIQAASEAIGFSMPSDFQTGALLQTLAASKPKASVLEIGTGTGLATAWLLAGMDATSNLISIDSEASYQTIANECLGQDARLQLVCTDAADWLVKQDHATFDLIFADAWPGKYANLEETLNLLKSGGFYVIDDMLPQPNWPAGHDKKADDLTHYLESRTDVQLVKMAWSTGIMLVVKK
ncbi:O-methyltransferase [Spirosoma luteum]|uniref:O-methyltransferase n=1 Tax=Spirosoma luteum TaxID=431553 RepID=UPI000380012F|nr:class I SAM-dependent methyltransferase [Spirosoma luteum]